MSWDFLRKEWGAVTFVLTVLLGLVVVPLTLWLGGSQTPFSPTSNAASSARTDASSPRTAVPTPSSTPASTPSP